MKKFLEALGQRRLVQRIGKWHDKKIDIFMSSLIISALLFLVFLPPFLCSLLLSLFVPFFGGKVLLVLGIGSGAFLAATLLLIPLLLCSLATSKHENRTINTHGKL